MSSELIREDSGVSKQADMPEIAQSSKSKTSDLVPLTELDLIHSWQPMGCRVVIKLPYVNDDKSPLLAIRVGPQIYSRYVRFINPVWPAPNEAGEWPTNDAVSVTWYDVPPPLATLASMHRGWSGTMKYRLRCNTNFVASGYIITSILRDQIAVYPYVKEFNVNIYGISRGYQRYMMNSYIMTDLSLTRHIEVEVPYEYPVPWYDQSAVDGYFNANVTTSLSTPQNAPINDTWLILSARGGLTSPTSGAEIVYELEYAGGEDFRFHSETLLPRGIWLMNEQESSYDITIPGTPDTSEDKVGVPYKRKETSKKDLSSSAKQQQSVITHFGYQVLPNTDNQQVEQLKLMTCKINTRKVQDKLIATFIGSPYSESFVRRLVKAGFAYNKKEKLTFCAFGTLKVTDWAESERPIIDHLDSEPSCPVFRKDAKLLNL